MSENEMMSPELVEELTGVAHQLADAARPIALRYFRRSGQGLENKDAGGFDPVTRADREIEAAQRALLAKLRPEDGILGEEYGAESGQSGLTWVLDPIDGTRGFISGTPTWGVLIAVGGAAGPEIGMIDQPFTGERFVGSPKGAVWQRGVDQHPLAVRTCSDLGSAVLFSITSLVIWAICAYVISNRLITLEMLGF